MFYGRKQQIYFTINELKERVVLDEKSEKMGPINLDISLNRLYEAWDEQAFSEVQDFKLDLN